MTGRLRLLVMAALVVGLGLLATGCSRVLAGQAQPAGGTAPQLAPLVANPKDARNVAPCALLSAQQALQLGVNAATQKEDTSQGLAGCSWDTVTDRNEIAPTFHISILLDVDHPERGGLNDVYLKNTVVYEIFQPMPPIDGYPSARADLSNQNACSLFVGIANTQDFAVFTDPYRSKTSVEQSCALSRGIAAAVLSNLPPMR